MRIEVISQKHIRHIILYVLLFFLVISCKDNASIPISVTKEYQFDNLPPGRKALTVTNSSSWVANMQLSRSAAFQNRLQWKTGGIKLDLEEASRFNANPPLVSASREIQKPAALSAFFEGNTKDFYVTNTSGQFETKTATLKKQSEYCNVWITNNASYNENNTTKYISDSDAKDISDTFDKIYPLETNLLGYEHGGGPGGDGGIDGDKHIQILIYNLAEDNTVGYFWSKDEYKQAVLNSSGNNNLKSNEAEIFYINASFFGKNYRDLLYSALIHEFQHMINFNRKTLRLWKASDIWYNEMMSALAEDIIGPLIGINTKSSGHPINSRIPLFLGLYWDVGITEWLSGDDVILSYSSVYAFGAYLVRNYGGPALLKAMMDNNAVNISSITQALREIPGNNVISFEQALNNYAESLLYSTTKSGSVPVGKPSFDRTQKSTINTKTYTAEAFDIWNMQMPQYLLQELAEIFHFTSNYKGPAIIPYNKWKTSMPAYSIFLQEIQPDITGTWTTTLTIQPSFAVINLNVVPY